MELLGKVKDLVSSSTTDYEDVNASKWLHGLLRIKIIRARKLKNMDGTARVLPSFVGNAISKVTKDVTDPFVEVFAGNSNRLVKTATILNNLNPDWAESEDHLVNIAQKFSHLVFKVKDDDIGVDQTVGVATIPVSELTEQEEKGEPIARLSKSLELTHHHGQLDVLVEYVPVAYLSRKHLLPNGYFEELSGNKIDLYLNADDIPGMTPEVPIPGGWDAPRLWRDVYAAIKNAKHFLYVTGWAFNTNMALVRDPSAEGYGETLGDIFKRKADEGVTVIVVLWNDASSTSVTNGLMGTHDQDTFNYFAGSKVNCRLFARAGDVKKQGILGASAVEATFTHHQKTIICDGGVSGIVAFVGGIDLTDGRYEDNRYSLFRTINSEHKGDSANHCFAVNDQCGPRQPWHDLHSKIDGPAAMDVVENFVERVKQQGEDLDRQLVNLKNLGLDKKTVASRMKSAEWNAQILRSIDSRSAQFDQNRILSSSQKQLALDGKNAVQLPFTISHKKGRFFDDSIHRAYVHMIRRAERFLYIENQYFLGSSYAWSNNTDKGCNNIIPMEIALKIVSKIKKGERFAAYILTPMYPEGEPASGPVQTILKFQANTMEMMYKIVGEALREYGPADAKPTDYLNFYCLGNRETADGSQALRAPETDIEKKLNETRRMMVYVHSKGMVVDDESIIIGSANINQRSMDGCRDSEIAVAAYQPRYTGDDVTNADIRGYRMHVFASNLGVSLEEARKPESLECVRRINEIAEENWKIYTGNNVVDMHSFLMKYPIDVDHNGCLKALAGSENIPDSSSPVLGNVNPALPALLTT